MLGKLIRHEWKSTYRVPCMILGLIVAVTAIGALGIILPYNLVMKDSEAFANQAALASFWTMMMVTSIFLYIIMLLGVSYGMMIYLGVHFYKSMYSDEGYLTHTLPVTPHQLLISKTLVGGIWYLLIWLSIGLSIFALVITMVFSTVGGMDFLDGRVWSELWDGARELGREMSGVVKFNVFHMIVSGILTVCVTPFSTMLMLFGALTIGQLSAKYKALMGILAYFGLLIVNTVITRIVSFFLTFGGVVLGSAGAAQTANVMPTYDSTLVAALIMGGGMYLVAHHILSKKLNME